VSTWVRRERRALGDVGDQIVPSRQRSIRTTAGQSVTQDRALSLSVVWDCVRLRADIVSTLPLRQYRALGDSAMPMPLAKFFTTPGGNKVGMEEWLYSGQVALDLRGNNFGKIVARDGLGKPVQIELLHPDSVKGWIDNKTGKFWYKIDGKKVDAYDVWHEKAFTMPGQIFGLSPLEYAASTMGIAMAAREFGAQWFADGAHPTAILSTDKPIDEQAAKTIKKRFMAALNGTREPVVLGLGVKYQAISVNANESQFLETIKASGQDVCRFFGMPPEMVGLDSGASMTYTNVEQRGIDLKAYRIGPTLVRRERQMSREILAAPHHVRFDADALARTDLLTRYKAYALAEHGGWIDTDEIRDAEKMPPMTDEQRARIAERVVKPPLAITPSSTDDGGTNA
jgi:HK97 family phage portal protein